MNPRRVHELMKEQFPPIDAVNRTWINLLERDGTVRISSLAALIDANIAADELLVEVHRKLGDFLPKANALKFIGEHIGQGEIRISDRSFQGFVVIAVSGAATGWSVALNSALHIDANPPVNASLKMTGTDPAGFIVTMPCGSVQTEFGPVVDALITNLASEFGNELDGIYLYGSVARGNARPNDSDLDVTLIFKDPLTDLQRREVEKLRVELQERHPEVAKIDFDIGLITDVLDPKNKYLWGYWIRHCCKCVWGRDLSSEFPLLKPSILIASAMTGDFHKVVEDYIAKIISQENCKNVLRLKREVSRKLIRSTNVLREQNDTSWPITLEDYYEAFCKAYPNECNELEYILEQARTPDLETGLFIQRIRSFSAWLGSASKMRQSL